MKTKTLLTLVVIALCTTSLSFAITVNLPGSEVKDVSLRLEGLSPDFAGLVDDEYTDFWVNPVDILNVKGGRLYTNLSNYITGNETQFGGASANEYLIGGVYSWENLGTFGLFLRNRTTSLDISGVTVFENRETALPVFFGRAINDALAFGIKVSYQDADVTGIPGNEYTVLSLAPGIKYQVNPEFAIGGLVKLANYDNVAASNNRWEIDGLAWGLAVQGWYQLNDATKIRGFISYDKIPLKGDSFTVAGVKDGDIDYDNSGWALGVGSATQLNEKLLLALGIKYTNAKAEETDTPLAGVGTMVTDQSVGTLILPVGLEYTMTDWLAFRAGASHKIANTENDVANTENTGSQTTYYYGAGLNITENLTVDVLGWKNLTELDNWRLSATVKF
ncbi:MAG: hypothetical protein QME64_05215 [bacterium]|nr:hypothetical protein [bacterium]